MCGLQAPWVLGTHRQYIGHLPAVCKRKQSLLRRAGCLRWMRLFGDSRQRQSNPSRRPQLLQQQRPLGRQVPPALPRSDTAAQIHSPMIIHASNKKLDGLCTLSVHCTVSSVQCTEPDIAIGAHLTVCAQVLAKCGPQLATLRRESESNTYNKENLKVCLN